MSWMHALRRRAVASFDLDSYAQAALPHEYGEAGRATHRVPDIATGNERKRRTTMRYYHADQVGLPYQLTSGSGSSDWSAHYGAWGTTQDPASLRVIANASSMNARGHQPLRFPGQYFDSETGLHYNMHRYYDPDTGRFAMHDPIGLRGGINLYRYTSNPNRWIDPLGLQPGKLNLVNPADPLWFFGELYQGLPGCFTVIAHGLANGQVTAGVGADRVSPPGLANAISHSPGYEDGMPVLLTACNSGKRDPASGEPYAQRLSNSLQAPVTAPNGVLNQVHGFDGHQMVAHFSPSQDIKFVDFYPQCRPRGATV
jgi:RHS repeat-associated protein